MAGSAGFTDALDAAVKAERRKRLIESMLSVIDLTKSVARLASGDGLPSVGAMTDLSTATDVVKGAGSANKATKGLTGQHGPSPALAAIAKLGQQVDGIAEGLDELHAAKVRITMEELDEKLAGARDTMAESSQAIVNLGHVAPTSAVLPDARQSLSGAVQRMRQIEARLRVAQSHLRAIARSRPATLARGGAVRALVDAAREQPESTTSLFVVQNVHLDVRVDASGAVLDERPHSVSYRVRADGVPDQERMKALGLKPGEEIDALGEAASRVALLYQQDGHPTPTLLTSALEVPRESRMPSRAISETLEPLPLCRCDEVEDIFQDARGVLTGSRCRPEGSTTARLEIDYGPRGLPLRIEEARGDLPPVNVPRTLTSLPGPRAHLPVAARTRAVVMSWTADGWIRSVHGELDGRRYGLALELAPTSIRLGWYFDDVAVGVWIETDSDGRPVLAIDHGPTGGEAVVLPIVEQPSP